MLKGFGSTRVSDFEDSEEQSEVAMKKGLRPGRQEKGFTLTQFS